MESDREADDKPQSKHERVRSYWRDRWQRRTDRSKYPARPNTPKRDRRPAPVRPTPPLTDPVRMLGHPARPRKRRR